MNWKMVALSLLGAVLLVLGLILRAKRRTWPGVPADADKKTKRKLKWKRRLPDILFWAGVWMAVSGIVTLVFGPSQRKLEIEVFAPMTSVFGFTLSTSVVTGWVVSAVLIVLCVLFRIFAVPRFVAHPRAGSIQNVMELAVEKLDAYCTSKLSAPLGENFSAYMFTVALFMIGCAAAELFGQRAPTSDLMMTFALSLSTFFLINYYGIKRKGIRGRIKSMASPTPLVFPIRILTDIAQPVSLACRLFGNMLGGLIVMDLLYYALGNYAMGLPALLGLYFNLFHPLIQAFIFITLSLTFINEAIE